MHYRWKLLTIVSILITCGIVFRIPILSYVANNAKRELVERVKQNNSCEKLVLFVDLHRGRFDQIAKAACADGENEKEIELQLDWKQLGFQSIPHLIVIPDQKTCLAREVRFVRGSRLYIAVKFDSSRPEENEGELLYQNGRVRVVDLSGS